MAIIKIKNQAIDLDAAEIPNLPATKITSGTFDNARISLDAAEIPNLDTAKITTGTLADARLPANALNSNVSVPNQSAFKNIIINGDMSIAQRGTSVSGIDGTESGYKTVDRMFTEISNAGAWTQSLSTTVPTAQGFAKSLKMDCTTADSTPTFLSVETHFEGQNLQYLKKGTSSAKSTTLSFWVKSNKTGTYICGLRDLDNDRAISKSYTISSADTWEKKTLTYAGDTSGDLGNDNGKSLGVTFFLAVSSTYSSGTLATSWGSRTNANRAVGQVNLADSTSNEWYITGVQLEAGTTASDFEFLPVDVNLERCLRNCFVVGNTPTNGERNRYANVGTYYTATQFFSNVYYPVVMRATPSFTAVGSNTAQAFTIYSANAGKTSTAVGRDAISATNIGYVITTASATQGDGGLGAWNLGYYGIIEAEL